MVTIHHHVCRCGQKIECEGIDCGRPDSEFLCKHKLTTADLMIIVDTLLGSQNIAEGGSLWKYTNEARRMVANKIIDLMDSTGMQVID